MAATNGNKILGWLTPSLAPTLYDMAVMYQADQIVVADTMRYSRKARVHRARIRTKDGVQWINIPVRTEDKNKSLLHARIDHSYDWQTPFINLLHHNYSSAVYYGHLWEELLALIERAGGYTYLLPYVSEFRSRLFRYLEVSLDSGKFLYLSELLHQKHQKESSDPDNDAAWLNPDPDRWLQELGCGSIMQEENSRHYIKQSPHKMEPAFEHPVYQQQYEGFRYGCSVIDLLFQYGPESFTVLDKLKG